MVTLRLYFGQEYHRSKVVSFSVCPDVNVPYYTGDGNLDLLVKVVSSVFHSSEVIIFLFAINNTYTILYTYLEEITLRPCIYPVQL